MDKFKTPVLFLVFNRPETTQKVFQRIRETRPAKLYVAADGPREEWPREKEKCDKVRSMATDVDWECEVKTLFRDKNLGCKYAVSNAINWFFEHEEMGIILEDDCLPNKSFFLFSEYMLNLYKNDYRIMKVSGTNNLSKWKNNIQDYHFSIYGSIWGWATWRRAWNFYDVSMSEFSNKITKDSLRHAIVNKKQFKRRLEILEKTYQGEIDTWDYQWSFTRLIRSGLSVVPSVNLVSNLGFNDEATHTNNPNSNQASLPTFSLKVKTINNFIVPDRDYDKKIVYDKNIWNRLKYKMKIMKFLDKINI